MVRVVDDIADGPELGDISSSGAIWGEVNGQACLADHAQIWVYTEHLDAYTKHGWKAGMESGNLTSVSRP